VLEGGFAFARRIGGELVEVGRGIVHAHRERTEIMQRGDLQLARGDGVEDARHQTDAGAMTELGKFKAEVADFAQHGAAIRVPMGIPTGRE